MSVGISEFVSQGELIEGVVKYRYTDFIVNEIAQDGEVVKPVKFVPQKPAEKKPAEEEKKEAVNIELTEEQEKRLKELLKEDDFLNF